MGRHEIRFRRQQMTSRRMERHKNYQDILDQHQSQRKTRWVRIILYIIAFLVLVFLLIFGLGQLNSGSPSTTSVEKGQTNTSSITFRYGTEKEPKT